LSSVQIKFNVGGREVPLDRFTDAIMKSVPEQVKSNIQKRLENARCPDHGQHPRVTVTAHSVDHLEFQIAGCCQKMIDEVTKALK
jgi:hypothetical protein